MPKVAIKNQKSNNVSSSSKIVQSQENELSNIETKIRDISTRLDQMSDTVSELSNSMFLNKLITIMFCIEKNEDFPQIEEINYSWMRLCYFPQGILPYFLSYEDQKVTIYKKMVLHTVMSKLSNSTIMYLGSLYKDNFWNAIFDYTDVHINSDEINPDVIKQVSKFWNQS